MIAAIIVAAGKGTRMGPGIDKVFIEAAGAPIIVHTWRRFDSVLMISEMVIVVRDGMQPAFEQIAGECQFKKPYRLVAGGLERQDSVWNGIEAVSAGTEIVAIQDAARPCTSEELIVRTIEAAREVGAAVAAQPITDTIKESDDGSFIRRTVDRSKLWSVQTPQTFKLDVIRRALQSVRQSGEVITDDTAACERIGQPVKLVSSRLPNPKLTAPGDLPFIETLLRSGG